MLKILSILLFQNVKKPLFLKEIELTISNDIEIANGYFPAAGDIIGFRYHPDTMEMTSIDLKSRKTDAKIGWITAFGGGKCSILFVDGTEKELIFDESTDVLTGYTPQKDDFVYCKTDADASRLTLLRFLSHPKDIESSKLYHQVQELAKKNNPQPEMQTPAPETEADSAQD